MLCGDPEKVDDEELKRVQVTTHRCTAKVSAAPSLKNKTPLLIHLSTPRFERGVLVEYASPEPQISAAPHTIGPHRRLQNAGSSPLYENIVVCSAAVYARPLNLTSAKSTPTAAIQGRARKDDRARESLPYLGASQHSHRLSTPVSSPSPSALLATAEHHTLPGSARKARPWQPAALRALTGALLHSKGPGEAHHGQAGPAPPLLHDEVSETERTSAPVCAFPVLPGRCVFYLPLLLTACVCCCRPNKRKRWFAWPAVGVASQCAPWINCARSRRSAGGGCSSDWAGG